MDGCWIALPYAYIPHFFFIVASLFFSLRSSCHTGGTWIRMATAKVLTHLIFGGYTFSRLLVYQLQHYILPIVYAFFRVCFAGVETVVTQKWCLGERSGKMHRAYTLKAYIKIRKARWNYKLKRAILWMAVHVHLAVCEFVAETYLACNSRSLPLAKRNWILDVCAH